MCDIVISNKKYIFGLHAYFWHRTLKPLKSLSDEKCKGFFCHVNKVTLGPSPQVGDRLPWEPTVWFQSHPLTSKRGGLEVGSVANGKWFSQPWLCDEAFAKTQKDGLGEVPGCWTREHVERVVCPLPHALPYLPSLPSGCSGQSRPLPTPLSLDYKFHSLFPFSRM